MTDDISDVIDESAEFIAEEADRLAEFAQQMNKTKVKFTLLGAICGAAAGAVVAWTIAYRRAERDQSARADDEIAAMREHYQAKGRALGAQSGKGDLAKIVKERGYSAPESESSERPPMAVQPPKAVVDAEDDQAGEPPDDSEMAENDVEGPNGVKVKGEAAVRNIFRDREQPVPYKWDRHTEVRRRSPDTPYVIHYDERHEMEGYSEVSFTYYSADDVLCNERDEVVDPADRDRLIGEANLERFGHGSGSPEIVFIRNDNLEILYEIIKSPNSFAEEVHGFSHEAWDRGNLERMRRREQDVED